MPNLDTPIHVTVKEPFPRSTEPVVNFGVQGPGGTEMAKALNAARESLIALKTPNVLGLISQYLTPYGVKSGPFYVVTDNNETLLNYQPVPSSRTVNVNAHVYVRGRGRPMPYPLEED